MGGDISKAWTHPRRIQANNFTLLFLSFWLCPASSWAQKQFTDYEKLDGSIQVGPTEDITLPRTWRGYSLLLPERDEPVDGLIVVFSGHRTLETISEPMKIYDRAFEQNLGVLSVSTGIPSDFYFQDERMLMVKSIIRDAAEKHSEFVSRPLENLSYVGFSIGGTQALKFTVYCQKHPSKCSLAPDSVTVVDAPLDMIRFWRATERAERIDFHRLSAGEGKWVSHWLEKNLGGTPHENREAYVEYSPYVYTWETVGDSLGGNAQHLKDIPIRAYAEPDVGWHIENRRRSYYSMNAIDMAALISDLKIMGNDNAELITTHNRRANPEESPHSWSIVDELELMKWIASHTGSE
ncbi:hypothetical protein [Salinibacter ruber]|uniref:hypothetical protein n=1 Tax=Salinibacter ruber TaxID=146919 RepID=UPI002166D71C|nr:hypothetical protein [Salinibacter ruber]MCS4200720.1 hypothetical protein [Salinibacter ruber]